MRFPLIPAIALTLFVAALLPVGRGSSSLTLEGEGSHQTISFEHAGRSLLAKKSPKKPHRRANGNKRSNEKNTKAALSGAGSFTDFSDIGSSSSGSGRGSRSRGTCAQCAKQLQELQQWFREYQKKGVAASLGQWSSSGATKAGAGSTSASTAAAAAAGGGGGAGGASTAVRSVEELRSQLQQKLQQLKELKSEKELLKRQLEQVFKEKRVLDKKLQDSNADWGTRVVTSESVEVASKLLESCKPPPALAAGKKLKKWKGYECAATDADMRRYLDYQPGQLCPDDWLFVQHLMFRKGCVSLPKRRCRNRTPAFTQQPVPLPTSLFDQSALHDSSVRWGQHSCGSFHCLNSRPSGVCLHCFNLSHEASRWSTRTLAPGSLTIKQVLAAKGQGIRIGLDIAGGTGSFAAHMAARNVTVLTTGMDINEGMGARKKGLPYLETVAMRGLIPLWLPYKVRLPFSDYTLDILHFTNATRLLSPADFEDVMFEWDRVLRVGGVLWLEDLTTLPSAMSAYQSKLEVLAYKRLHWDEREVKEGEGEKMVVLNCLLEKPVRSDADSPERDSEGVIEPDAGSGGHAVEQ